MVALSSKSSSQIQKIGQKELDEIVRKHNDFLVGRRGGARANLRFTDLSYLDLRGVDLSHSQFTGSILIGTKMAGGLFQSSCFFGCNLQNADLTGSTMIRVDLRGAQLEGADLTGANLEGADLREGRIMECNDKGILVEREPDDDIFAFEEDYAWSTSFCGAKLSYTNFTGVKAKSTDFSDADLTGAVLQKTNMVDANFSFANLSDTDFAGSDLSNAQFEQSVMVGTNLDFAETQGASLDDVLNEIYMGMTLEDKGENIEELLKAHKEWVASAGKSGQQMDISNTNLRDIVDLNKYKLTAIIAVGSKFLSQDLSFIEMQSATLDQSDMRDCNMQEADLRGSSFVGAQLSRSIMRRTLLCPLAFGNKKQRVNFSGAQMRYVDFEGADLRDAILMGADLSNCVFTECDLRRADLTGANLEGTNLDDANLEGTILD